MQVFVQELRRMLKSSLTRVLVGGVMAIALILFVVTMVSTPFFTYRDGAVVKESGPAAIRLYREQAETIPDELSGEYLAGLFESYRAIRAQYGEDIPPEIYYRDVFPYYQLMNMVRFDYYDPVTEHLPQLEDISPEMAAGYYEQHAQSMELVFERIAQANPAAEAHYRRLNEQVVTPYTYVPDGGWRDGVDYLVVCVFLVALVGVVLASSSFAGEYQTGSDDILRSTQHGRKSLATAKIMATLTVTTLTFVLSVGLLLILLMATLGTDFFTSSVQAVMSSSMAAPLTFGSMLAIVLAGGLLSVLAVTAFSLFVSSRCGSPVVALVISLATTFVPTFLTFIGVDFAPVVWLRALLPSAGVGLGSGLFYALQYPDCLPAAGLAIWQPYAMVLFAAVEIPIFILLARWTYAKRRTQ